MRIVETLSGYASIGIWAPILLVVLRFAQGVGGAALMAVEHTVAVGALINMFLIWMFDLRLRTHLLLGGVPESGHPFVTARGAWANIPQVQ